MRQWLTAALLAGTLGVVGRVHAEGLVLEQAWVRAMPPTMSSTAAYLVVRNDGQSPLTINGASSPVAGKVELHNSVHVDGMSRMERVHELTLAPGDSASLAPGGLHLMLLDLAAMPQPGESVELCLHAGEDRFCVAAPVRRDAAGQDSPHHHHNH